VFSDPLAGREELAVILPTSAVEHFRLPLLAPRVMT